MGPKRLVLTLAIRNTILYFVQLRIAKVKTSLFGTHRQHLIGLTRFKRTPQVKEEPNFFFSNPDLWMVIDRIGLPIGARAYAVASQDCPLAAQTIKNDS